MPKRIIKGKVVVYRDGKAVSPDKGTVFDFTDKELSDINSVNPASIERIVIEDEPKPVAAPEPKVK